MTPYDVYERYLSIRMHFTSPEYNYFKYSGKIRTSKESFNKRKDRYFFEKLSRKKTEKEVVEFFVSNFIESSDPSKMWVGELKEKGEENYISWKGRVQSLTYKFNEDLKILTKNNHLFEVLFSDKGHPKIIKQYLGGKVSIETLVIFDNLTSFMSKLNSNDPVLDIVIHKVNKYKPFLSYDKEKFVEKIREIL